MRAVSTPPFGNYQVGGLLQIQSMLGQLSLWKNAASQKESSSILIE